jgi:haloalkane dehalogenase
MQVLRTPEAAFSSLPDFPFLPRYLDVIDRPTGLALRVHYVDEGPTDGPLALLLHGEPTWSYLYRHMIPLLVAAGFRVLAPDLIGFGKSDKPADRADYSYARQVDWMSEWFVRLDVRDAILVCQDWGSLIGLRLLTAMPERFAGVAIANGGLPEGQPAPRAFAVWRAFSRFSPVFPIGRIVSAGCRRRLSPGEIAAYNAPFPTSSYTAAPRVFPALVPFAGDPAVADQKRAWRVLEHWQKPFLCCFSDGDPITRGGESRLIGRIPGTVGLPHQTLKGGHFIQEDDPAGFVRAIQHVQRHIRAG